MSIIPNQKYSKNGCVNGMIIFKMAKKIKTDDSHVHPFNLINVCTKFFIYFQLYPLLLTLYGLFEFELIQNNQ